MTSINNIRDDGNDYDDDDEFGLDDYFVSARNGTSTDDDDDNDMFEDAVDEIVGENENDDEQTHYEEEALSRQSQVVATVLTKEEIVATIGVNPNAQSDAAEYLYHESDTNRSSDNQDKGLLQVGEAVLAEKKHHQQQDDDNDNDSFVFDMNDNTDVGSGIETPYDYQYDESSTNSASVYRPRFGSAPQTQRKRIIGSEAVQHDKDVPSATIRPRLPTSPSFRTPSSSAFSSSTTMTSGNNNNNTINNSTNTAFASRKMRTNHLSSSATGPGSTSSGFRHSSSTTINNNNFSKMMAPYNYHRRTLSYQPQSGTSTSNTSGVGGSNNSSFHPFQHQRTTSSGLVSPSLLQSQKNLKSLSFDGTGGGGTISGEQQQQYYHSQYQHPFPPPPPPPPFPIGSGGDGSQSSSSWMNTTNTSIGSTPNPTGGGIGSGSTTSSKGTAAAAASSALQQQRKMIINSAGSQRFVYDDDDRTLLEIPLPPPPPPLLPFSSSRPSPPLPPLVPVPDSHQSHHYHSQQTTTTTSTGISSRSPIEQFSSPLSETAYNNNNYEVTTASTSLVSPLEQQQERYPRPRMMMDDKLQQYRGEHKDDEVPQNEGLLCVVSPPSSLSVLNESIDSDNCNDNIDKSVLLVPQELSSYDASTNGDENGSSNPLDNDRVPSTMSDSNVNHDVVVVGASNRSALVPEDGPPTAVVPAVRSVEEEEEKEGHHAIVVDAMNHKNDIISSSLVLQGLPPQPSLLLQNSVTPRSSANLNRRNTNVEYLGSSSMEKDSNIHYISSGGSGTSMEHDVGSTALVLLEEPRLIPVTADENDDDREQQQHQEQTHPQHQQQLLSQSSSSTSQQRPPQEAVIREMPSSSSALRTRTNQEDTATDEKRCVSSVATDEQTQPQQQQQPPRPQCLSEGSEIVLGSFSLTSYSESRSFSPTTAPGAAEQSTKKNAPNDQDHSSSSRMEKKEQEGDGMVEIMQSIQEQQQEQEQPLQQQGQEVATKAFSSETDNTNNHLTAGEGCTSTTEAAPRSHQEEQQKVLVAPRPRRIEELDVAASMSPLVVLPPRRTTTNETIMQHQPQPAQIIHECTTASESNNNNKEQEQVWQRRRRRQQQQQRAAASADNTHGTRRESNNDNDSSTSTTSLSLPPPARLSPFETHNVVVVPSSLEKDEEESFVFDNNNSSSKNFNMSLTSTLEGDPSIAGMSSTRSLVRFHQEVQLSNQSILIVEANNEDEHPQQQQQQRQPRRGTMDSCVRQNYSNGYDKEEFYYTDNSMHVPKDFLPSDDNEDEEDEDHDHHHKTSSDKPLVMTTMDVATNNATTSSNVISGHPSSSPYVMNKQMTRSDDTTQSPQRQNEGGDGGGGVVVVAHDLTKSKSRVHTLPPPSLDIEEDGVRGGQQRVSVSSRLESSSHPGTDNNTLPPLPPPLRSYSHRSSTNTTRTSNIVNNKSHHTNTNNTPNNNGKDDDYGSQQSSSQQPLPPWKICWWNALSCVWYSICCGLSEQVAKTYYDEDLDNAMNMHGRHGHGHAAHAHHQSTEFNGNDDEYEYDDYYDDDGFENDEEAAVAPGDEPSLDNKERKNEEYRDSQHLSGEEFTAEEQQHKRHYERERRQRQRVRRDDVLGGEGDVAASHKSAGGPPSRSSLRRLSSSTRWTRKAQEEWDIRRSMIQSNLFQSQSGGISWTRVSYFVVTYAPCFWLAPRTDVNTATDRLTAKRLNIMGIFFGLLQIAMGMFCAIVFTWTKYEGTTVETELVERYTYVSPNLWNPVSSIFLLGIVGFILVVAFGFNLYTLGDAHLVRFMRFYWLIKWLLPVELIGAIGLFDYHGVTRVWVEHWWNTPAFSWFRNRYCPTGTADEQCAAPYILTGDEEKGTLWCQIQYEGATNCYEIQTNAQNSMVRDMTILFSFGFIGGLLLSFLLFLVQQNLESIVTRPIIRRSKERNIPVWLTLPIIGSAYGGASLLFAPSSLIVSFGGSVYWIGVMYLIIAGTFFFSAILGMFVSLTSVMSPEDKRRKRWAVTLFIITMVVTILSCVALFTASLTYSSSLIDFGITDERRGDIACDADLAESCTRCQTPEDDDSSTLSFTTEYYDGRDGSAGSISTISSNIGGSDDIRKCPEWTASDVTIILLAQLKQSAALAAIFFMYAVSALRFGILQKHYVSRYQIDYV